MPSHLTQFPLLALPPELRLKIYTHFYQDAQEDHYTNAGFLLLEHEFSAFVARQYGPLHYTTLIPIGPVQVMHNAHEYFWGCEPMTRLLRVCRLVNREATNVLYSRFEFYVAPWTLEYVDTFFGTITRSCAAMIRKFCFHVQIHIASRRSEAYAAICAKAPALCEVNVILEGTPRCAHLGHDGQFTRSVESILGALRPLKDVRTLRLSYFTEKWQRDLTRPELLDDERIFDTVKERIEGGGW